MNAGRAQFTEAATFFAGYFRKVREEMNAGRAKFTEAEPKLPDTSVKSEEKYEILQPILQKEDL
jgi:hypothetical protein